MEELEARLRQNDQPPSVVNPNIPRLITPGAPNNDNQQDMNAFKKLLAQISENNNRNQMEMNQHHQPQQQPPHHQQNILQQNEMLQKMLHLNNQMHHPGGEYK